MRILKIFISWLNSPFRNCVKPSQYSQSGIEHNSAKNGDVKTETLPTPRFQPWFMTRPGHLKLDKLRMFCFFDSYGGRGPTGGQKLQAEFEFDGEDELVVILNTFELDVTRYSEMPEKYQSVEPNTGERRMIDPIIVEGTEWIRNPGHTEVFGEPVFIWCYKDKVSVSLSGGSKGVSQQLVNRAATIEKQVESLLPLVIDRARRPFR